jgi:Flp pilus assembly protein TadG
MSSRRVNHLCLIRESRPFRTGAATVEFAFLLPVLVIILLGALEVGNMLFVKSALQNAAREGARRAILPLATRAAVTTFCNRSLAPTGLTGTTFTITPDPYSAKPGTMISVSVSTCYSQNSWLPSGGMLGDRQIVSTVVMRKE